MASTSGRSSRSTLTGTKCSFMNAAVSASSNDSCSITWHQWHDEYPIESRIGRSSSRARSSAASPHGYQSTGLSACWSRYGEVSCASRLGITLRLPGRCTLTRGPAEEGGGMPVDLTIVLKDEPGQLARLGETTGEAGVNLQGMCAMTGDGHGYVHVLVDDAKADRAREALEAAGMGVADEREALGIDIEARPGT